MLSLGSLGAAAALRFRTIGYVLSYFLATFIAIAFVNLCGSKPRLAVKASSRSLRSERSASEFLISPP